MSSRTRAVAGEALGAVVLLGSIAGSGIKGKRLVGPFLGAHLNSMVSVADATPGRTPPVAVARELGAS